MRHDSLGWRLVAEHGATRQGISQVQQILMT